MAAFDQAAADGQPHLGGLRVEQHVVPVVQIPSGDGAAPPADAFVQLAQGVLDAFREKAILVPAQVCGIGEGRGEVLADVVAVCEGSSEAPEVNVVLRAYSSRSVHRSVVEDVVQ